jgi:hypothetical protein
MSQDFTRTPLWSRPTNSKRKTWQNQNFNLEHLGWLDRPPMAVKPPHPENLASGQPSSSHHLISQITPRIAAKLRGYLGYLMGNLSTKGHPSKRSQSNGNARLRPLGHELEEHIKPLNRGWFNRVAGSRSPRKEAQDTHTWHPTRIRQKNHAQNSAMKITRKTAKNHQKGEMGETTKRLEEPHRNFYTCKEGSYKV